jgi:hypothetical protein
MEELLRQILEELKFQSKQIEKLTLVTAALKQPCGKGLKDVRKLFESIPGMKDHPMKPMMDQFVRMAEGAAGGEENGD